MFLHVFAVHILTTRCVNEHRNVVGDLSNIGQPGK